MGHARPRVGVSGKTRWAPVDLDLHGRERSAGTFPSNGRPTAPGRPGNRW